MSTMLVKDILGQELRILCKSSSPLSFASAHTQQNHPATFPFCTAFPAFPSTESNRAWRDLLPSKILSPDTQPWLTRFRWNWLYPTSKTRLGNPANICLPPIALSECSTLACIQEQQQWRRPRRNTLACSTLSRVSPKRGSLQRRCESRLHTSLSTSFSPRSTICCGQMDHEAPLHLLLPTSLSHDPKKQANTKIAYERRDRQGRWLRGQGSYVQRLQ